MHFSELLVLRESFVFPDVGTCLSILCFGCHLVVLVSLCVLYPANRTPIIGSRSIIME